MRDGNELYSWQAARGIMVRHPGKSKEESRRCGAKGTMSISNGGLIMGRQTRSKESYVDPYDVWRSVLDIIESKVGMERLLAPAKQRKTGQLYKGSRICIGDPLSGNGFKSKDTDARERARTALRVGRDWGV